MSAHAKTPWRFQCEVETAPGQRPQTFYSLYTVSGPYGHPATCDSAADAEFIVRACNAHDDLLAALKALLPEGWDEGHMDHMPGVRAARLAISSARPRCSGSGLVGSGWLGSTIHPCPGCDSCSPRPTLPKAEPTAGQEGKRG